MASNYQFYQYKDELKSLIDRALLLAEDPKIRKPSQLGK